MVAMLVVVLVILYESSQPHGSKAVPDLTTNEAYVGHFLIYSAMAFCAMTVLGRLTLQGVVGVFLVALGLGVAMELYQMHVPSRTASDLDAMADAAGAIAGILTYTMAAMLMEPYARRQPTKS